jgi:hypothetical protein
MFIVAEVLYCGLFIGVWLSIIYGALAKVRLIAYLKSGGEESYRSLRRGLANGEAGDAYALDLYNKYRRFYVNGWLVMLVVVVGGFVLAWVSVAVSH